MSPSLLSHKQAFRLGNFGDLSRGARIWRDFGWVLVNLLD